MKDNIIISEIRNEVSSIDFSFSTVAWMDWSDDLGSLDYELLGQDAIVFDNNMNEDRMICGFKSLVVNTKSDEVNCFGKGLDVSSVYISYEVQLSELVNLSEIYQEDILNVSYSDENSPVIYDDILD